MNLSRIQHQPCVLQSELDAKMTACALKYARLNSKKHTSLWLHKLIRPLPALARLLNFLRKGGE